MKAKEPRISVRVDESLKGRIEAVSRRTGVDEADLVRNCIEALCAHVEESGSITFPMEVIPAKKNLAGAAFSPPRRGTDDRIIK